MAGLDLAAIVNGAKGTVVSLGLADTYTVYRATATADDAGGWTGDPLPVESGTAILTVGGTRPVERAVADRAQATAPYTLSLLPWSTLLAASDTVRVGSRTFEVVDVLKAEGQRTHATAVLEEQV